MNVLTSEIWQDGFLDYYRASNEYRIQVLAWRNLEKLEGFYFIRQKSFRLLWNYLCEVGLRVVLRKILSRSRERYRNEKYISFGLGKVIESFDETDFPIGQFVAFLAPCHPQCIERIVLPKELMIKVHKDDIRQILREDVILYQPVSNNDITAGKDYWWAKLRCWNRHSGEIISDNESVEVKKKVIEYVKQTDWRLSRTLLIDGQYSVSERARRQTKHGQKIAVLFGYGNYAKTNILPNLESFISIDCIHELDPTQIPVSRSDFCWDTSPYLRESENYDVYLLAGYHHTHTPLAIHALKHDAIAVVEKPIVVSNEQLNDLIHAMKNSKGHLFSCYHKRYQIFNEMVINDIGLKKDDPISYHCVVYEVPLPELHWYRWPNSRSRLVSNGCHWIDHFLYLNNFREVRSFDLVVAYNGAINCSVTLANGSLFTMVLTDQGSERIGVQDYIEIRANGVTVKMVNGSKYMSENKHRIIRKKKINKMQSYKEMYQQIGQKIVNGESGDTIQSVKVSAGLIIALEERLSGLMSDGNVL